MKTSIRIHNEKVTGIVVSDNVPDGYFAVDQDILPKDINLKMNKYIFKDGKFVLDQSYNENIHKVQKIRLSRDRLLTASDWTQIPDAPVDQAAWATYRQALRDVPQQEGFPENVIWPTPPSP